LVPRDEFGFRLLRVLFGVLAVPALYLVARRLVGTRAALFGALLLTVNTLHVYHSQYARYWSLVFVLSTVYPYAIYLGIRDRNPGALALGLLAGVLALLAHPVSALLVGGLGGWIMVLHLKRDRLTPLWKQRTARWLALEVVVLAGAVVAWYLPVLRSWVLAHGGGRPKSTCYSFRVGRA
jgi:uncharacterized membrane protein